MTKEMTRMLTSVLLAGAVLLNSASAANAAECLVSLDCDEVFSLSLDASAIVLPTCPPGGVTSAGGLGVRVRSNRVDGSGVPLPWELYAQSSGDMVGPGGSIPVANLTTACSLGTAGPSDVIHSAGSVSLSSGAPGVSIENGGRSLGLDGNGIAAQGTYSLAVPPPTLAGPYACTVTYTLF